MRTLIPLVLLIGACSDYGINKRTDPNNNQDSDPDTDTDDTADLPDEEECNGEDDDGDGEVDEGYPDSDGDGTADCEDSDCEVAIPSHGTCEIDETCAGDVTPEIEDPWNVAIEWHWTDTTAGSGVIVMPAIGNLTDDDGDGDIDENDDPDVAFTTWGSNHLIALHGDGSGVIFDETGYDGNAGVTIADVDNDGQPEVVAATTDHRVAAVDGSGTQEWSSNTFAWSYYPQPAVADLDADGDVEVVMDIAVVEGADGSTVATLSGITTSWRTPICADIDDDGSQEIILGERVFDSGGSYLWSSTSTGWGNFAAVADIDGDTGGEVFFAAGSAVYVHDEDGTALDSWTIPGSNPGPPCMADFDGDGEVEIATPANTTISVWDTDGTMVWSAPIDDSSGLAGCSGYDVNGDGAYEVLYSDQNDTKIYDGASGDVLYTNTDHSSGTLWEYPATADVDNDGSAEIVYASNGGTYNGVTVLGHDGDGWAKSGPTWGTHDFAVTNLGQDNTVPTVPALSWMEYNVFRARPTVDEPGSPDLVPVPGEICVASCEDGPIKISYAVENRGTWGAKTGIPVTLYGIDGSSVTVLETQYLAQVSAGEREPGGVFEIHPSAWKEALAIRVDDDGTGFSDLAECHEDNNELLYADKPCE